MSRGFPSSTRTENILIADKPAGMIVHSDDAESYNTLINNIKAYLYQRRRI